MLLRRMALVMIVGTVVGLGRTASAQDLYPKETESYLINYMALSKSTTTAYLLSAGPGFGAGHFWAGQTATGAIMAIGQLVGIGLYIIGTEAGLEGNAAKAVWISGAVIFAGFRIADLVIAPRSAEAFNRDLAKRLKIKPLALHAPSPDGRGGSLAYGLALQADLGT